MVLCCAMNKQGAAVSRPPSGKSSFEVAEQLHCPERVWVTSPSQGEGEGEGCFSNGADAPNPSPQSSPLRQGERRKGSPGVLRLGGMKADNVKHAIGIWGLNSE
jgi:hypothetical protein